MKGKQTKSNQAGNTGNGGRYLLILLPLIVALAAVFYPMQRVRHYEGILESQLAAAETKMDSLNARQKFEEEYGSKLQSAKDRSLKLGLDLQGGMYVTLELNLLDLIKSNADVDLDDYVMVPEDDPFRKALAATEEAMAENPDLDAIEEFKTQFDEVSEGKSLTAYFTDAKYEESEEKIIEILNQEADDAISGTQEIIRQRIDKYGVSEPNIQQQGERRIMLELPGVKNEAGVKSLIQTTAQLSFHHVRTNDTIVRAFQKIDERLAKQLVPEEKGTDSPAVEEANEVMTQGEAADTVAAETEETAEIAEAGETAEEVDADTTEAEAVDYAAEAETETEAADQAEMSDEAVFEEYRKDHPFTTLFATTSYDNGINQFDYSQANVPTGKYRFYITKSNLNKFLELLETPDVQSLIPSKYTIMAAAKPLPMSAEQEASGAEPTYEFYCLLKKDCFAPFGVKENIVSDAGISTDETGMPAVTMTMPTTAAKAWAQITGESVNQQIAIVLDNRVYSAPNVNQQIIGGNSQITGMDDYEEADRLMIVLKSGRMKTTVNIIEERLVGPSLGQASISSGLNASLIAVCLIILFMAVYYTKGGLTADYAVIINVLLILALLTTMKGTLTLPGIAGIILTMGMAVDANVLIFERIREELAIGRSIRSAIDEGYRKALSAILDANVTTAITAIILFSLGSGPIKGFATTVLIGIFCTLFTAILVTRAFVNISLSKGAVGFNFGQPKERA